MRRLGGWFLTTRGVRPIGIENAHWSTWTPQDVKAWARLVAPDIPSEQLMKFESEHISGRVLDIIKAHDLERWGIAGGPAVLLASAARRLTSAEDPVAADREKANCSTNNHRNASNAAPEGATGPQESAGPATSTSAGTSSSSSASSLDVEALRREYARLAERVQRLEELNGVEPTAAGKKRAARFIYIFFLSAICAVLCWVLFWYMMLAWYAWACTPSLPSRPPGGYHHVRYCVYQRPREAAQQSPSA